MCSVQSISELSEAPQDFPQEVGLMIVINVQSLVFARPPACFRVFHRKCCRHGRRTETPIPIPALVLLHCCCCCCCRCCCSYCCCCYSYSYC